MPLKDLLRTRLETPFREYDTKTGNRSAWKALVTDAHSQHVLEYVYTREELLERKNLTSMASLHSQRKKESVDAIYILTPTTQNADRLIADFTNGQEIYKAVYLYFIDAIDDALADKIMSSLGSRLKDFQELFCNFESPEERVFTTGSKFSLFSFFGPLGGIVGADPAMEAFLDDVATSSRTLVNVLATMNENPYIRYYHPQHHAPLGPLAEPAGRPGAPPGRQEPPQQSGQSLRWRSALGGGSHGSSAAFKGEYLSQKIASKVQDDLDRYMALNPEFPAASERPRGVLFVVDRSLDPAAPLLHEFWYQAMVNDLLPVENGTKYKYKYENTVGGKETREAILDEKDEIWVSVRHLHMKDAIDKLMTDFGKFAAEHAGFNGNPHQVQMNDLKDMLASLPQFQEQRDQYSLHLDMAQQCMDIFQHHGLDRAANVEQCCATGFTPDGKTPKTIVQDMVPLLDDRGRSNLDKVRIIALYIIFRGGVADEDRRRLYQHARLSVMEQDMINNLVQLGVQVVKDESDRRFNGKHGIKNKYSPNDESYDVSRYKPVVGLVIQDQVSSRPDKPDTQTFPYMRDQPPRATGGSLRSSDHSPAVTPQTSLRSARPTWHKASSARQINDNQQRIIVFVAGGVTYSEIRQAYVLSQTLGKDIIIGSTHIITPESFLKDLKSLGRGGVGGNAPGKMNSLPQGHPGRLVNREPGTEIKYQGILDEKYWEPSVGPPPLPPPPMDPHAAGKHGKHAKNSRQHLGAPGELDRQFSDMSISSSSSSKYKDGEKKSKNVFKRLIR